MYYIIDIFTWLVPTVLIVGSQNDQSQASANEIEPQRLNDINIYQSRFPNDNVYLRMLAWKHAPFSTWRASWLKAKELNHTITSSQNPKSTGPWWPSQCRNVATIYKCHRSHSWSKMMSTMSITFPPQHVNALPEIHPWFGSTRKPEPWDIR